MGNHIGNHRIGDAHLREILRQAQTRVERFDCAVQRLRLGDPHSLLHAVPFLAQDIIIITQASRQADGIERTVMQV